MTLGLGSDRRELLAPALLFTDRPAHTRLRRAISSHLSPKAAERLRPRIRAIVRAAFGGRPPDAELDVVEARLKELHAAYRDDYRAYYERHATEDSPPMRGADPAIVLVPGVGMFSFGANKQTARVAGEFYVNAINVMRGAESISTYAPIFRYF